MHVNNELITDTFEITNTLNNHFASFATDSSISNANSQKFSLHSFQNMMKSDNIFLNNGNFNFVKMITDEVIYLLKDLESSSSPGISGLPVSILKKRQECV